MHMGVVEQDHSMQPRLAHKFHTRCISVAANNCFACKAAAEGQALYSGSTASLDVSH